jgi:hypothetical protein
MAYNDIKRITMNTPKGTAKWPKLSEPDYGTKDYPKPDGEYSVKLVFDETDPKFLQFKARMALTTRPPKLPLKLPSTH